MDFRMWLEQTELADDPVAEAILGVVGEDQALGDDEKEFLLNRNTNDFSNDIQNELKNLGIVKGLSDEDPQRYNGIVDSIENGITIKDLIEKVKGRDYAPNADLNLTISQRPSKGDFPLPRIGQ